MALLSIEERNAMAATAQLNGLMKRIIGRGPTGEQDLSEFVIHLHAIQNMILAQAAARAYPDTYRLLGERLL